MSREPGEAGSSVVGGSRLTAEPRLLAWQWRVSLSRCQAEEWDITWQVSGWWGNFWLQREASGVRPGLILVLLPAMGPWQISASL